MRQYSKIGKDFEGLLKIVYFQGLLNILFSATLSSPGLGFNEIQIFLHYYPSPSLEEESQDIRKKDQMARE